MPEICLPASFSGHTVMSTDERNEANHEYNFFLDRKIQEQLFDADENLDKTAQTNTQIKTPRKGNTSKNSVQSQTEICEWIPRTGFALRRPEKEINNNNNGTSKKKEDSSHGAPANWRDPHGRQKEIDFKFRHYYDIRKYIEQYRKHHTCQVPVRGLSGKLYRQYLQQAQTQTFEQNFAIGAGYQEPKSCTPPELVHVNQSSNQDGYKYKTTSRAIKYDHDYDKGQSSFGERSSKGQNYNVTLTPTKVGVRDGVPYPMSASPKVLRQPPGMPVVNIVQPRDSSHAVPMTPQHTIDLLAKMTVASDKQVFDEYPVDLARISWHRKLQLLRTCPPVTTEGHSEVELGSKVNVTGRGQLRHVKSTGDLLEGENVPIRCERGNGKNRKNGSSQYVAHLKMVTANKPKLFNDDVSMDFAGGYGNYLNLRRYGITDEERFRQYIEEKRQKGVDIKAYYNNFDDEYLPFKKQNIPLSKKSEANSKPPECRGGGWKLIPPIKGTELVPNFPVKSTISKEDYPVTSMETKVKYRMPVSVQYGDVSLPRRGSGTLSSGMVKNGDF